MDNKRIQYNYINLRKILNLEAKSSVWSTDTKYKSRTQTMLNINEFDCIFKYSKIIQRPLVNITPWHQDINLVKRLAYL